MKNDLDNYITGHYGEDQFKEPKPLTKAALIERLKFFTDSCPIYVPVDGGDGEVMYCPVLDVAVGFNGCNLAIDLTLGAVISGVERMKEMPATCQIDADTEARNNVDLPHEGEK